jgi:hypothetical protein
MSFIAQQRVAYASSSLHTENHRVAAHAVLAITAAFDAITPRAKRCKNR